MKVLENTTIEGESPVVEHIYPTLDDVPKYQSCLDHPDEHESVREVMPCSLLVTT
jgi:hypothetical protein